MEVLIGHIGISASLILIPIAALFYAGKTHRVLATTLPKNNRQHLSFLLLTLVGGGLGAYLYGIPGSREFDDQTVGNTIVSSIKFGSFGGYWGVFAACLLFAFISRDSALRRLDAVVPGLLGGGAIARAQGLLNLPSVNRTLGWNTTLGQISWTIIDIVLHTVLLAFLEWRVFRGRMFDGDAIVVFLAGYGFGRFMLECFRSDNMPGLIVNYGHVAAVMQVLVGIWLYIRVRSRCSA